MLIEICVSLYLNFTWIHLFYLQGLFTPLSLNPSPGMHSVGVGKLKKYTK